MRGLVATGMVIAVAAEPLIGDIDLVKYAITQGGLFALVIVLLVGFRREFRRQLADEQAKTSDADRRSDMLMTLVGQANAAMQKAAVAADAQEKATHRLARAIEKLEIRRG